MDGYLAKPVDTKKPYYILDKIVKGKGNEQNIFN